jgi:hypothetical protein
MIGQLYHCLKQGTTYDESLAFGAPPTEAGLRRSAGSEAGFEGGSLL